MPDTGRMPPDAMPPTLKLGWLDRRFPMIDAKLLITLRPKHGMKMTVRSRIREGVR